jgi:hypothetical protein
MAQAQRADQPTDAAAAHPRTGREPVDKFQDGPVQVSIFQNPSSKGDFRTAKLEVRYKDKDGQFQTSHSYTASVLKHIASASISASEKISQWEEENKSKTQAQAR